MQLKYTVPPLLQLHFKLHPSLFNLSFYAIVVQTLDTSKILMPRTKQRWVVTSSLKN
eukprot:m.25930 g.25930  ORF g.25930 m.25930 type:complete len:57 (-) comp9947_c0_seq2:570-740(-)